MRLQTVPEIIIIYRFSEREGMDFGALCALTPVCSERSTGGGGMHLCSM